MKQRFAVKHSEESLDFLTELGEKSRNKILYNIDRASYLNDPELFKKLKNKIWEFRTLFQKTHYRLLGFWDKTEENEKFVVVSHGFVKKTSKVPKKELAKAEKFRKNYFDQKDI